jgi:hypothetical protein
VTDAECRAYLLGRLTPAEADRLEARMLDDDELFQAARSAEDDLFDAFARGQLLPDDRSRFLERFGGDRDRIAFARAFAARRGGVPQRPQFWVPLAAAALLAVAVGAAWWLHARSLPPATPVVATQAPPPAPVPAVPPVVALLTLSTSRAAGAPPAIVLPRDASSLDLTVRLNPADRFDAYTMELRSPADAVVWRGEGVKGSVTSSGDLIVMGRVPASTLADGVYELSVRGGGNDLGYLSVRIMHTP